MSGGWQFFPASLNPPRKGGGVGMGQDFSPAPLGGAGMGLYFLDPPHPTPPHPALLRVIIVKYAYTKTLLFKQTY